MRNILVIELNNQYVALELRTNVDNTTTQRSGQRAATVCACALVWLWSRLRLVIAFRVFTYIVMPYGYGPCDYGPYNYGLYSHGI